MLLKSKHEYWTKFIIFNLIVASQNNYKTMAYDKNLDKSTKHLGGSNFEYFQEIDLVHELSS